MPLRRRWRSGRRLRWAVGGRRSRLTARRCAASMVRSCPGCAWWWPTTCRPAWCARERGVRDKTAGIGPRAEAVEPEELAEEKARAELSVATPLLVTVRLAGRVVTGDALYCQRTLCQLIRQAHA